MPILHEDQLQELVDEARLGAVSVDTNVFHRFGYNLEAAAVRALAQFPAHGIAHLVSDVVAGEVRAHMVENEVRAGLDLRSALKRYAKARKRDTEEVRRVSEALDLDEDMTASVERVWRDFLVATDATLVSGDQVNAAALVSRYFEVLPPFESKADKKAEFPDAIALLELEGYGERHGCHVLAITQDQGWKLFAETARWVVVVDDLAEAINLLHSADAIAAERAVTLLADPVSGVRDDVDAALGEFIAGLDPEIRSESHMEVSSGVSGVRLVEIQPVDPTSASVLESDADTVTLTFGVDLDVEVEAQFSFYMHDAGDDDYLGMGFLRGSRRTTMTAPVTLKVPRGVSEDDGAVSVRIERLRSPIVDFGYVEPSGWRADG